jgi:hypothetical protein
MSVPMSYLLQSCLPIRLTYFNSVFLCILLTSVLSVAVPYIPQLALSDCLTYLRILSVCVLFLPERLSCLPVCLYSLPAYLACLLPLRLSVLSVLNVCAHILPAFGLNLSQILGSSNKKCARFKVKTSRHTKLCETHF